MVKLIILAAAVLSIHADMTKPLNLNEYWGVSRSQDFVSGGIPLPKSLITDIRQIGVFDNLGAQVPLQTRDLMKWPDGSLRWVLLTFPADAAAQNATQYQLKLSQTPSFTSPAYSQGQVAVTETASDVTVSTGKLTFTIRKTGMGFNLFERVLIAKDADGLVNDEIVSPSLQNGAIIWDKFDSAYTTGNDLTYKVKVEEQGPLCTVIKITGSHSNGSTDPKFYGYLCRIYAYAGKSYLKVQYSVKNSYLHARGVLAMNGMSIRLKANLAGAQQVTMYGGSAVASAPLNDSAYVYQWRQNNFWAKNGSVTVDSGSRALGWIDVSDSNWGVAIGDYEFASNCPNELAVHTGGWVEGRFFPRRYPQGTAADSVNYKQTDRFFVGLGENKTHRFCLYFHKGSAQTAATGNVMAAFNHPLLPIMDRDYVSLTRAVPGEIAAGTGAVYNPATTLMPLVNDPLQKAPYTGMGSTINTQYYDSWCSFGEAFWRNETQDTEIMENQGCRYLRYLNPYTYRVFEANAWLYADFRRCHIDSAVCYAPPAATYYTPWWSNTTKDPVHSYINGVPLPTAHRWIQPSLGSNGEHYSDRDLFLGYLVTGDFKLRDALYEFAQLHNRTLTWWGSAGTITMTDAYNGQMSRGDGSPWLSLTMAALVENTTDTINGQTPQKYFTHLVTEWVNGRPGYKYGILNTMTQVGVWYKFWLKESATDSIFGPHVFMESIVDMPFCWYMENWWSDTLKPYLDRHVKCWRDTVFADSSGLEYHGFGVPGKKTTSYSNWRVPGPTALLYFFSGDTGLLGHVRKVVANNPFLLDATWDHPYFSRGDLTFSQAYLLEEKYPSLFLKNPIITWSFDPTAVEAAVQRAELSPLRIFPNPLQPRTVIALDRGKLAPRTGDFKVRIFDVRGREVALLKGGAAASAVVWNTSRLSSGVYWVRVEAGGKQYHQKAILIK